MSANRPLLIALALVLLSGVVQVVTISRAAVPALDSVRFVQIAQTIEQQGLTAAITGSSEQPLFPVWVWAVHQGLEAVLGPRPSLWAWSVQWAAAVALIVAVVPIFYLARRLVGVGAAAAGGVLFCVLPEVARLGADGLSDGLHLLFAGLALWAIVAWWFRPDAFRFLLPAGVAIGLALLTRAESVAIPLAWGVAVLVSLSRRERVAAKPPGEGGSRTGTAWPPMFLTRGRKMPAPDAEDVAGRGEWRPQEPTQEQDKPGWRFSKGGQAAHGTRSSATRSSATRSSATRSSATRSSATRISMGQSLAAAGWLACGMALVLLPYVWATGVNTPREAMARVLGRAEIAEPAESATSLPKAIWDTPEGRGLAFPVKEPSASLRRPGLISAGLLWAQGLAEAFGYVGGAFAVAGLWRRRARFHRPADRFVQVFSVLLSGLVLWHGSKHGYLCPRHLMLLVAVGVGVMGLGTLTAARWVAVWMKRRQDARAAQPARWTWACVGLLALACLAPGLRPLHGNQGAFGEAGRWLAAQSDIGGVVLDTKGWTALYSDRPTYQYDEAKGALADRRLAYVVVRADELNHPTDRSRTLGRLLQTAGRPVARFGDEPAGGVARHVVVVYRWDAARFERTVQAWTRNPSDQRAIR